MLSVLLASWTLLSPQQPIDPQPVPQPLPHLIGTPVALGDLDVPPNGLDAGDLVLSDEGERARNTYGFALLDASNGFDMVLAELVQAHPELGNFTPLAAVEGSMMLFDPPLHVPLRPGESRRIIRGSGGLRLYLTHNGGQEIETSSFAQLGGTLQEQRKFLPHAGLLQTAESLSTDQPAKWSALLDILPPMDISVRSVHAFRGVDGYPWIAVGCSVVTAAIDPADAADALAAKTNRLLRWNRGTLRWDDVTATNLLGQIPDQSWGVASGDLNLDGRADLVFGHYGDDFGGAKNEIYLSDGAGVFRLLPLSDSPFGSLPIDPTTDVIVADLDVDGFLDIVVANAWVNRVLSTPSHAFGWARNYVLWGQAPSGTTPQGLAIPRFSAVHYLDQSTEPFGPRDTVALDVADADGDGWLDIVAGNHGTIGAPFVPDGYLPGECGAPRLEDVVYDLNVQAGTRTFTRYELKSNSACKRQATTDIRFVDVVSPPRLPPPAFGQKWDFTRVMVQPVPGAPADGPWEGLDHRDGFPEIVRVLRGRGGSRLEYFLNDPNRQLATVHNLPDGSGGTSQAQVSSFDSYYARDTVAGWVLRNQYNLGGPSGPPTLLPPLEPLYSWRFLKLFGEARHPANGPFLGCWVLTSSDRPARPAFLPDRLESYNGLNTLGISAYANALAIADFVPDRAWQPGTYVNGVHWPAADGLPDLLLGLGYELSGLPNRLIPFCSSNEVVERIEGGLMPGLLDPGVRGSYAWTSGWTEKTNKGYGSDLVDVDNDGDLDAVTSNRVDGVLFVNQGTPATPNGREGQFVRVKDQNLWPETDLPYAHNLCFAEDSSSADFDEDGDLDVFMVGMVGMHYYGPQHARGQRNEDDQGQSWFASVPFAERFMNDAHYLENQTQQGTSGGFVSRGELLDMSGRVVQGIGADRVFPGDFDGDGDVDALGTMWSCLAQGSPGYTMDPSDPTLNLWDPNLPSYPDTIAAHKALAFRMWMNQPATTVPGAPFEFVDEADSRIRCKTTGGAVHFGTLDAKGAPDHAIGTQYEPLHTRNWLSTAVADLNNDGSLDFFGVYSPLAGGKNGYNVFLNDGTGVLWDLPNVPGTIPSFEDANFAGPNGATLVGSFSSLLTDYDVDGDFDALVSFFSVHYRTALLENQFASTSVPVNPYDPTLPGARFVARPRYTSGAIPGWLEGEQPSFNAEPGYGCEAAGSTTTWIGSIDLDLDGDADVTQVENSPGHRFYLNHGIDAMSPHAALEERSGDSGTGFTCGPQMPDLATIFWGTRLTSHNSALPVDFDAGDLNGDGLPDLFVNYDSRPANAYFNDGTRGVDVAVGIDPDAALISRVWPPSGGRRGETIRIHGLKMVNIRYVQFLLGPDANGPQAPIVILNTTPGAITTYPHQRYIDVVVPPSVSGLDTRCGPAAIVVGRRKNPTTVVPSPVYRTQAFAIIP